MTPPAVFARTHPVPLLNLHARKVLAQLGRSVTCGPAAPERCVGADPAV
jgi:hypothetical protein